MHKAMHEGLALLVLLVLVAVVAGVPDVTRASSRDEAVATFDHASELAREGRLAEAVLAYRSARLIFERSTPFDPHDLELAEEGLAAALLVHRDLVEARKLAERILERRRGEESERSPALARAERLAGRIDEAAGRFESAREHYLAARGIRRRIHGNHHPSVLSILLEEGRVLTKQGRLNEAEIMALQAASLGRSQTDSADPLVFESVLVLAENAWRRDDPAEAERYYRMALDTGDAALSRLDRRWVDAFRGLARCRIDDGDLDEAARLLERAVAIYDDAWWLAGAGDARAMFQTSPHADLAVVEVLRGHAEVAWEAAEAHQSRLLSLDLALHRLGADLRAQLERTRRALVQAELSLGEARRSEKDARHLQARQEWLDASGRWEELMEEAPRQAFEELRVSSAQVAAALPAGAALIRWIDLEVRPDEWVSFLGLLTGDHSVQWIRQPSAEVGSMVAPEVRLTATAELARLESQRLAGALPRLRECDRWYVIPSGQSVSLPIEALPTARDRVVQATPSGSWLVHGVARRRVLPQAPALVFADPGGTSAPAVGEDNHLHGSATPAELPRLTDHAGSSRGDTEVLRSSLAGNLAAMRRLSPLPGARREARAVRAALPHTRIFEGPAATEPRLGEYLEADSPPGVSVLHLATHALVDDLVPGRSALVLALPEEEDAPFDRDGLLTVEEIRGRWSLDCDLVVLSACETALGPKAGGEGHLGFAQTLLACGARQLVLSRWKVDDTATSIFMEHFYQSLDAQIEAESVLDPAAALRDARVGVQEFENGAGRRPFEDPFYWAAFTCLGGR